LEVIVTIVCKDAWTHYRKYTVIFFITSVIIQYYKINNNANVYGDVITARPLREFTRFLR